MGRHGKRFKPLELEDQFGLQKIGSPSGERSEAAFRVNNPFVTIREEGGMAVDKIGDGKRMQPDVLKAVMKAMAKSQYRAHIMTRGQDQDDVAVYHPPWLQDLWTLTTPFGSGGDQLEDLVIRFGDYKKTVVTHRWYDYGVLAFDPALKAWVTVLAIVSHRDCPSFGIYQAADSICHAEAVDNVKLGRYEPIFVECWGVESWRYGVLWPRGVVRIRDDGKAVKESGEISPGADLDKMLSSATEELRRFKGKPDANYLTRLYVHGELFVPAKEYFLPCVSSPSPGLRPGSKLFLQSLVRILVGDTALSWTVGDVERRLRQRAEMLAEVEKAFFDPHCDAPFVVYELRDAP